MEHGGIRAAPAHLRDLLSARYMHSFLHQHPVVIGVRSQVVSAMFDDDELSVTTEPAPGIDDLTFGRGINGRTERTRDVETPVAGLREVVE